MWSADHLIFFSFLKTSIIQKYLGEMEFKLRHISQSKDAPTVVLVYSIIHAFW